MKTSYFAKYKGLNGINIAIKAAPGFVGDSYPELFPKWSFLKQYKVDLDEEAYTKEYYEQVLSKLDPQKVYEELKGKTLLCWEKTGSLCHRRLVAKWIQESTSIEVPECHE